MASKSFSFSGDDEDEPERDAAAPPSHRGVTPSRPSAPTGGRTPGLAQDYDEDPDGTMSFDDSHASIAQPGAPPSATGASAAPAVQREASTAVQRVSTPAPATQHPDQSGDSLLGSSDGSLKSSGHAAAAQLHPSHSQLQVTPLLHASHGRSPAPDALYVDDTGGSDGGDSAASAYSAESFAAEDSGGGGATHMLQRQPSQTDSQRSARVAASASSSRPPSRTPAAAASGISPITSSEDEDAVKVAQHTGPPPLRPTSARSSAAPTAPASRAASIAPSREASGRAFHPPVAPQPQRDIYEDDDEDDGNGGSVAAHSTGPAPNHGRSNGRASSASNYSSVDGNGAPTRASLTPRSLRPLSATSGTRAGHAVGRSSITGSGSQGDGSSVYSGTAGSGTVGSSPMVGRQRPASAGRGARELSDLMAHHPSTWDVRDVCVWVEYMGLGQYRSKFAHNCVAGALLLKLTDEQLKRELQIGPLGHRQALLEGIATVLAEAGDAAGGDGEEGHVAQSTMRRRTITRPVSARQEYPRRPASASPSVIPNDAYLGPALGKFTVYEQRAKLLFELDRAQARANQQRALVDQLTHTADLTKEDVAKLRGLIQDLEYKNKMAVQATTGGLDRDARIPWSPVGYGTKVANRQPQLIARPGDDPSLDELFKPFDTPSAMSKKILEENYGASAQKSKFLDRLQNDQKKRERAVKEVDRKYYSREALMNDPMLAKRELQKDLEFLGAEFQARYRVQLSDDAREYNGQINDVFESYGDDLKVQDGQLKLILKATGSKKVAAAASAIRTKMFMDRYTSELKGKKHREKALEKKWWEQTGAGGPSGGVAGKEAVDRAQAAEFFGLLGWRGEDDDDESLSDMRLDALLRRARAYKEKYDGWKERTRHVPSDSASQFICDIRWDRAPFQSDGLQEVMVVEMQRAQDAMKRSSVATARPSTAPHERTRHAPPDGSVEVQPLVEAGLDYLLYTVKLLAGLRVDDLERLERDLQGRPKRLATYRAVRTLKFLEFTGADIKERDRKLQEVYSGLRQPRVVLQRPAMDSFFERLMEDGYKRQEKRTRAIQDKMSKEADILKSSQMYTRPRPQSARR